MKNKTVELRGNATLEELLSQILSSSQEELIVAFGKTASSNDGYIFLVQEAALADEAYLNRSYAGLKWDARLTAQWVRKAETSGLGIVLIHAHGNRGKVGFSPTDSATKERILPHVDEYLSSRLSGYIVIGQDDFSGEFVYKIKRFPLGLIRSVGCPVTKRSKSEPAYTHSAIHDRQELALGEAASALLRSSTIGLVGLGGAGSMVAEQLAHLGVGRIILVDGDQLEDSNVSRVVGATVNDINKPKTFIAKRTIRKVDKLVGIIRMDEFFPTPKIYQNLKDADVIISCVDKVNARKALVNFCKRYIVPVIDVGVTIRKDKTGKVEYISGQVVRMMPSNRCLKCLSIVSDALEKQEDIQNYGAGKARNPQVITYNGVLASLAVGEMLKLITAVAGTDNETSLLSFDGLSGVVEKIILPSYVCDICKSQYAQGDPD